MKNKNTPLPYYKKMKVSGKYLLACFGEMFPLTFIYDTKAENMLFGKVK